MQGYPSQRMPFPQWQPGMAPHGLMNVVHGQRTGFSHVTTNTFATLPRQGFLPFPKQFQLRNGASSPHMLKNNSGPHMQNNNSGPRMQNNNSSGPRMKNIISGPRMQNNNSGLLMQNNNSGLHMQNNAIGPRLQNSNSGPHMLNNNGGPIIQNNNNVPHMKNNNSGPRMNNNIGPHMQNNNIGPRMQNNESILLMQNNKHFVNSNLHGGTAMWKTKLVSPEVPYRVTNMEESPTYVRESGMVKGRRPKFQAVKLHQKIAMLQKELSEKNKNLKTLSKEVNEYKEKTAEVMKGNKHLVEIIKKKDFELGSNKVEMVNMKADIKCAQKEVLNCLQAKMARSEGLDVLNNNPAKLEKKRLDVAVAVQTNIDDNFGGRFEEKFACENDSNTLCHEIQSFLEFHGLARMIGKSIEKALDTENKAVATNWDVFREEFESSVSTFQGNVVLLFDEIISVVKKKVEVDNCLSDIEKKIGEKQVKMKKMTTEIEELLKKIKKLSEKDIESSAKIHALVTEMNSFETELVQLKKSHRKLEIENKRIVNKINVIASKFSK